MLREIVFAETVDLRIETVDPRIEAVDLHFERIEPAVGRLTLTGRRFGDKSDVIVNALDEHAHFAAERFELAVVNH